MPKCRNCDSTQFRLADGLYYCEQCETEFEQFQEEVEYDEHQITSNVSEIKSSVKRKVVQPKSDTSTEAWLSFEAFGIILCHQVSALIELGASPQLRKVVFQLWTTYLQKCKICFKENTSSKNWTPCLGLMPRRRDLRVLCGVEEIKSKMRKKTTKEHHKSPKRSKKNIEGDPSEVTSNDLQDSPQSVDSLTCSTVSNASELHFPKRGPCKRLSFGQQKIPPAVTNEAKRRLPDYMVLPKTLSFCYLGILLIEDMLLLGDIIRFAKEGHFPYMDTISYLPSYMKLSPGDHHMIMPGISPTMSTSILYSTSLAKFLCLPRLKHPPLLPIAARFIRDFNLSSSLVKHVQVVISQLKYKEYWCPCDAVTKNNIGIQYYEVKAMAAILVTLKLLFGLDGISEEKHSKLVKKINTIVPSLRLFVWSEWLSVMKLKVEFLSSQSMSYSKINQIVDVESLAVFYQATFQKWSSKLQHARKKKSFDSDFRSSLRSVLSDVVLKKNFSGVSLPPTSFPLSRNNHHGTLAARSSRQHSASRFLDCDLLKKDFSAYSAHYLHRRLKHICSSNTKALKLLKKLNNAFYCKKSSDSSSLNASYWHLKCTRKDYCAIYKSAPPAFKWLVDFSSEMIECNNCDLFYEVCILEKTIFKFE